MKTKHVDASCKGKSDLNFGIYKKCPIIPNLFNFQKHENTLTQVSKVWDAIRCV